MKFFSSSTILHLLVCIPAAVSSTNVRKIGNKKDGKAATQLATRGLWQHPINPGYDLHCPCLKQAMAELSAGMSQALTKADFTLLNLLQPQEDLADVLQEIASQGMDCLGRLVNCQQTTDSEECCCDAETLKGAFLAHMNTVASYKKINPDDFYGAMRMLTEDCFGFSTPECGNGIVEPGEDCDDGNAIDDDGCTNDCQFPPCRGRKLGYVRRYMAGSSQQAEDVPSKEKSLKIIHGLGGSPDATFSFKEKLLSEIEGSKIKKFIEISQENSKICSSISSLPDFMKTDLPTDTCDRYSLPSPDYDFHQVDVPASDLLDMIGHERIIELLDALEEYAGREIPITRIRGRSTPPAPSKHLAYHLDHDLVAHMLIELNEGYSGAEIVYLTRDGPAVLNRTLGSAVVHGPDAVHGTTSQIGNDRFVLEVFSDEDPLAKKLFDKDAVISHLF